MFTYDDPCYSCLPMFIRALLSMFIHVYSCLPMFTCSPMFTHVYLYFLVHVNICLSMFIRV